jgi:hypothetical protein
MIIDRKFNMGVGRNYVVKRRYRESEVSHTQYLKITGFPTSQE